MPESVGKTLKKIRESKQLSIEGISERTRISKKNISAIEEDKLHEIASVFYARGFVRSYAQFLGASEEKAIREYLGGGQKRDKTVLILDGEKVPCDWFIKHKKHIGTAILLIVAILTVSFSFLQMRKFVRHLGSMYKARVARKREAEKKEAVFQGVPVVESGKIDGLKLDIVARSDSWIQVVSDGELLFRGILRKGTEDTWQAKKEIRLKLGNAGGVTLRLNEENIGVLGKRGEKREIVITQDGIK